MKVLVTGAGIAGNALAFWLTKIGHQVTVIERFPALRTTGLQLDLRGFGVDVLKLMGLDQAFREKSIDEQGIQIVGSTGRQWAWFPVNRSGKGVQSMSTEYEIMRGDLCRMFHDACGGKAKFLFGKTIKDLKQGNNEVDICFDDETKETFDLVIGADGSGSRTRIEMLKPGPDPRNFGDLSTAYFTIPLKIQPGEDYRVSFYMATGGRMVMTRRHDPEYIQVYFIARSDIKEMKDLRLKSVQEQKEACAKTFRDAGWEMEKYVDLMMEHVEDFYFERQAFVKLDSWSRGNVTLCGDAAWAASANTGMGTTSAVVGAYILAGEISKHCPDGDKTNLSAALQGYEDRFLPFVKQVQKDAADFSWPSGSLGIAMANVVMWVLARLRVNIFGMMLSEDVKDWELPRYEALLKEKN
jgi:2-polyprenyl-6-methoxyphenol hydroxylase-like FAD-dependent oxidoreductase